MKAPHRRLLALLAGGVLALASCSQPEAERAWYYWKSARPPQADELAAFAHSDARLLYLRLFDLDVDGSERGSLKLGPEAAADLRSRTRLIPVVYVLNGLFRSNPVPASAQAAVVAGKIQERWALAAGDEVQIDCDWTPGTREAYFAWLEKLRRALPAGTTLSVTVRLHQARDRESNGIPPADRGMLMAYNLGNPAADRQESAILDLSTLEAYAPSLGDYPLPLDVALPLWSWISWFEGQRFLGLIADPGAMEALQSGAFTLLADGSYEAREAGTLAGRDYEAGDRFRLDRTLPETVEAAARLLARSMPRERRRLALFHLDAGVIDAFAGPGGDGPVAVWQAFR